MKCRTCHKKWAQHDGLCRGCAVAAGVPPKRKPSSICTRCGERWVQRSGLCKPCLRAAADGAVAAKAAAAAPKAPAPTPRPKPAAPEFEVVWSGGRDAPSLIGDRPSKPGS